MNEYLVSLYVRNSYFLFQLMLHSWCNKGHGVCYPVWDGVYKRILAANQKEWVSSLYDWFFTICPTPYNCEIKCVVWLNQID